MTISCSGHLPYSRIIRSYLLDVLIIALAFCPYFAIERLEPFQRTVYRDDRAIMFPHKDSEIIPNWALPFFSFVIPVFMIVGWMVVCRFQNKKMVVVFVGLLLSLAITVETTALIKILVGRLRPDFLARCRPDPSILEHVVCLGAKSKIAEGRKSFPSGHTSSSFSGLGYAGFFLAGQLGVFDGKNYAYKFIISAIPFGIAGFVGISRIMDFRHHWSDVLAGALLGLGIAYLCYRMYFPPIMNLGSDKLYEDRFRQLEEEVNTDTDEAGGDKEAPNTNSAGVYAV